MTIDEHLELETLPNYFDLVVSRAGESVELRNPLLQGRNTIMEQPHANVRRAKTGALA